MKLLEICLNSSLGGLELYFSWCAEYFHETQKNVLAVTLQKSRLDTLLQQKNLPIKYLKKPKGLALWTEAFKLARLFESEKIDVVHVHFKNDLLLVALAKKLSRRSVFVVHTRQMEMPGFKKDLYHRWIYAQVDRLICVTQKLQNEVRERVPMPPEKILSLYYGVKQPQKNEQQAQEFFKKFPSELLKVAMFSRIEDGKGQDKLLQVLKKFKAKGQPFQAYIFGHFMKLEFEQELHRYVKDNGLSSYVSWCGFQKDPVNLMPFFDVIVMPSVQETFGLVLIEAMAAQVAVMGSNTGGVPEIIDEGQTGYMFSPHNVDEFEQKLRRLLESPEHRQLIAQQGHQKYLESFQYQKHFEKLNEILTSC